MGSKPTTLADTIKSWQNKLIQSYEDAYGKPLTMTCEICQRKEVEMKHALRVPVPEEDMELIACNDCYWQFWREHDALSLI